MDDSFCVVRVPARSVEPWPTCFLPAGDYSGRMVAGESGNHQFVIDLMPEQLIALGAAFVGDDRAGLEVDITKLVAEGVVTILS